MSAANPKKPLYITDTTLRDAHQSLIATRLRTGDMLPLARLLDRAGFWSVEAWGGATFDSCIRFLAEDPWERLRLLKESLPNTRVQMLLRGQNLVGTATTPTTWSTVSSRPPSRTALISSGSSTHSTTSGTWSGP